MKNTGDKDIERTPRERSPKTDDTHQRRGAEKIPPDDQQTPGENGDDSGGGLRGA